MPDSSAIAAPDAPCEASTSGRVSDVPADHPTLGLIQQRARQGCKPGQRRDGFKLGLVVEGGGMRGIISGAMLMVRAAAVPVGPSAGHARWWGILW